MSASNEEELEEIISSFRRVWRSGGRASLSLHANQGELEARVVNILKATSATKRKILVSNSYTACVTGTTGSSAWTLFTRSSQWKIREIIKDANSAPTELRSE